MNKKIIITGATGLIGRKLSLKLSAQKNEITIFTRNIEKAKRLIKDADNYVRWNYNNPEEWKDYLNGVDSVIHLAGTNLDAKRWDDEFKKELFKSRIESTRQLVNAIRSCGDKPKSFITASAVGFYGDRGEEVLKEKSNPGKDFLSNLCLEWEKEAEKIEEQNVRRVSLRIGIVLSNDGGVLKKLIPAFKLLLGGPLGNGKQWFPWIHIEDLTNIIIQSINTESLKGPVNAASPGIVRMNDFATSLGKVLRRPSFFKVPKFVLKIAIGEFADAIVSSQKVSADKLLSSGFNFRFTDLEEAIKNLLGR